MTTVKFQRHSTQLHLSNFLNKLTGLLDDDIDVYCPQDAKKISRVQLDGLWLIKGQINQQPVAVIWSDFRVKGGSFGKYACEALQAFLQCNEIANLPLIIGVNSLGFRFMEGRTIFNSVFGIIPAISQHKKNNLVLTACFGQCLGLGALVFGLGHYRIASEQDTTVNLAGPEVFKMFFGDKNAFDDVAGTRRQYIKTDLIHEIADDLTEVKTRLKAVFSASQLKNHSFHFALKQPAGHKVSKITPSSVGESNLLELLSHASDEHFELFSGYSERLKAYILQIDGQFVGLLANPLKNVNNMFTSRTLTLYLEAIKLFKFLNLPLVTMLDTPGIDPRMDGNNQRTIDKVLSVTEEILNYSNKTIGIVTGRGYGGANTLAIPKVYGSEAAYILDQDTEMNVMHESIIRKLLTGSPRLLDQWQTANQQQCAQFTDLIGSGNIDRVINKTELKTVIIHHLLDQQVQPKHDNLALV